ncbi:MAG: hypothetical protein AB1597_02430 [Chloroflexota bacterium]
MNVAKRCALTLCHQPVAKIVVGGDGIPGFFVILVHVERGCPAHRLLAPFAVAVVDEGRGNGVLDYLNGPVLDIPGDIAAIPGQHIAVGVG